MTKLAKLIAQIEGFGIPDAIPTVRKNPGDLRHSPHSEHPGGMGHEDDIGTIDTDAHGWADLERQLGLYALRGMTLEQAIYEFAPPSENDSARYLQFVIDGFQGAVSAETPLHVVLSIV
jgi:hypothetical protein